MSEGRSTSIEVKHKANGRLSITIRVYDTCDLQWRDANTGEWFTAATGGFDRILKSARDHDAFVWRIVRHSDGVIIAQSKE